MDQLSQIISKFSIQAGVFYTGKLCGLSSFEQNAIEGHIHVLKSGRLKVTGLSIGDRVLTEPSIIFIPRPQSHRLMAGADDDAELVCATLQYGIGNINPVTQALPDVLVLPLARAPQLLQNLNWVLSESTSAKQGHQAIMDRLMEVFIVSMLRHLIEQNKMQKGLLAGMAHGQLSKVLQAIQEEPGHSWTLDEMADIALMSRAKFAALFKNVIDKTPNDYLTDWRVSVAQKLLLDGKPVSLVAQSVGYDSPSTLSRAFQKKCQLSPKAWLKRMNE
ncbi:AraC family transcriptional regulator [Thalassotalea atypica]|uniref:AraC family transcriptional regulator n=1 Tax=Thalassotalea atypica TaxID=2054316 RepID=UPI0025733FA4|nr:AraC family transcriptional regulator [Thalassotalea atypica]